MLLDTEFTIKYLSGEPRHGRGSGVAGLGRQTSARVAAGGVVERRTREYWRRLFTASALALLVLLAGCAGTARIPDPSYQPAKNEGVVFGRFALSLNGTNIPAQGPGVLSQYNLAIANFVSVQETMAHGSIIIAPVETRILVQRPDGYFAAVLPPGKYYLESYMLPYQSVTQFNLKRYGQNSTYMMHNYADKLSYCQTLPNRAYVDQIIGSTYPSPSFYAPMANLYVKNPQILVFEVPPEGSVYIGTLKVEMDDSFRGKVAIHWKDCGQKDCPPVPDVAMWGVATSSVVDEWGSAEGTFQAMLPQLTLPQKRLAECIRIP